GSPCAGPGDPVPARRRRSGMHVGATRQAAGADSRWARRWLLAGLLGATALSAGLLPSPTAAVEAPPELATYRLEVASAPVSDDSIVDAAPRVQLSDSPAPGFHGTLGRLAELRLAL